ncbi:MAG: Gfo/Idh/MocA family oxidoreductase [Pseudomonadota bacterium]
MKLPGECLAVAGLRESQEKPPLACAVVGLGRFGSIHARKLSVLPEFRLDAVVDSAPHAREAARALGVPVFASVDELPPHIQAATVATDAASHAAVAISLMQRGCHVLVEKPLATSRADSQKMLDTASCIGVHLCTGHTLRFAEALDQDTLMRLQATAAQVSSCEAPLLAFRRFSRWGVLVRDSVLDLMVHDLDLMTLILDASPDEPMSVIQCSAGENSIRATVQLARVQVSLESGYRAQQESIATLDVMPADAPSWRVDLHRQSGQYDDPLTRQYRAFARRIRGEPGIIATGRDGGIAVSRALQILAA